MGRWLIPPQLIELGLFFDVKWTRVDPILWFRKIWKKNLNCGPSTRFVALCDGFWRRTIIHQFINWSLNGSCWTTWFTVCTSLRSIAAECVDNSTQVANSRPIQAETTAKMLLLTAISSHCSRQFWPRTLEWTSRKRLCNIGQCYFLRQSEAYGPMFSRGAGASLSEKIFQKQRPKKAAHLTVPNTTNRNCLHCGQ